jgi:hypothetical protein
VIRKPCLSGLLALAAALIAGCGTPSYSPAKPDDAQVKQFSGRGYLTDDQYGIATTYASWQNGDAAYEVSLTVPAKPGRYPLVIYLPGLGEGRMAGEAWRTAWARGGYTVLSLQPLAEDARAWSSARARAGDFALLARERYSGKAMSDRLQALRGALQELVRRQSANDPPLDRADLSKVALAGFDLGAFTAMTVAGEGLRDVVVPQLPLSIRAVIALSPYASFSGPSFASRYRSIRLPVLSITSDADADALGVVTSPSLRKAPFEYMPPGDKYLALLAGMPHRVFSGTSPGLYEDPDSRPAESGTSSRGAGSNGGSRGGGGHGHYSGAVSAAAAGSHGGHGGEGGNTGGADGGRAAPRENARQGASPTALAMGVAAVQGISTAFLDAVMKEDGIAREWLEKDANRWLRDKGELKHK